MRSSVRHPFLDHLDRAAALEAAAPRARWAPGDLVLPSLYTSHGAPPLFEDAGWRPSARRRPGCPTPT